MPLMNAALSALVLVDYQQRLLPAIHEGDRVLAQAVRLAEVARALGVPVLGTEQYPQGLGPNHEAVRSRCALTLLKMHFDACADGLIDRLPPRLDGLPREVVIAGCEAHVCLLQTAMGLLAGGRKVYVVADACGSRAPEHHALAMQRLQRAGADIVSVEMVGFEWLRGRGHPQFKDVLALLK